MAPLASPDFAPLLESLSPSAIVALRQASAKRPCWTCPIEAHGGLGAIWTWHEHAPRRPSDLAPHGEVSVPIDPTAILEAACDVARGRGYTVAGWSLTTVIGVRGWLIVESPETGHGRANACYVETHILDVIEVALHVLRNADALAAVPGVLPPLRRVDDEDTQELVPLEGRRNGDEDEKGGHH